MLTLILAASVAMAGWTETAREHDCVFYKGTAEGDVTPVRAECDWAIAPDKLHGLLAKWADHAKYFESVKEGRVVEQRGDLTWCYQAHQASGIGDREAMLDMSIEAIDGGKRYLWVKSTDQSGITGDRVELDFDTGKWEVTSAGTGSKVVYELRYDPGGSVPGFLVRWFQGAGMRDLVGELRSYAESH